MIKIDYANLDKEIVCNRSHVKNSNIDFHLHEGYELYFLLSGEVNYFVEKKIYPLQSGEIILTNNHEIHKPSYKPNTIYERYCLQFNPSLVKQFNSENFDLLDCFINRTSGEHNKLTLTTQQTDIILEYLNKIASTNDKITNGQDILRLTYLIELLVFINRVKMKISTYTDVTVANISDKLSPVLEYIDNHLDGELDLDTLGKVFYVDKFYLSKLFKKNIGSSIHSYIIYKRISKAKALLAEGHNVTDTCLKCGFNDYSNFLKIFKRTVGMPPGKYKRK